MSSSRAGSMQGVPLQPAGVSLIEGLISTRASEDAVEGTHAFAEKRKPVWRNR